MAEARLRIPRQEFEQRVRKIQEIMNAHDIDLLVTHACECESANVRYLSGFWAVFDFAGVLVPREGNPILLTGGPESYDFAKQFSEIEDVRIHPMYVETAAPEWDKPTEEINFGSIVEEFHQHFPIKTIGIADSNIIPYQIMKDLQKGAPDAEYKEAQWIINKVREIKTENEIALLKEAYRITEQAFIDSLDTIKPGVREWEIEAAWRASAYKMGAEGTSYPIWITSGDTTFQSLCRSSDKLIVDNSMVQITVGAKYNGYCGNFCRAVVLGEIPKRHEYMINVARECVDETVELIKPGVSFASVYDKFQQRLAKNGFSGLNLYGPAHGTGMQEVECAWVDNRTDKVFQSGMVFNVDIWIADHQYGVRIEDGLYVTDSGVELFASYPREMIRL
jgi:Xaa-Pro aminopeptidase